MADDLKVIIIAGPNGAGKTTFAREFLPNEAACPVFVNADLIAAGLAPFAPESAAVQAGRLMLTELERHFQARQSFAFETTLSGRGYLRHIARWQAAGYRIELIFLRLAQCMACGEQRSVPHSCGHRSCPHCQHHEAQVWLQRQLQSLVPATYFLITFTLPGELRAPRAESSTRRPSPRHA